MQRSNRGSDASCLCAALAGIFIVAAQLAAAAGPIRAPIGPVLTPLPGPAEQVGGRRTLMAAPQGPAPQNLRVLSNGPMARRLMWDRLPGINGYIVLRSNPASAGQWNWLQQNPAPLLAEQYDETGFIAAGSAYRVIALYPDGRQGSADFVYANPPPLEVPAGFTAQQVGAGQVRLSWQAVKFAKGYRVYGSGQPADGSFVAATSMLLTNMPNGSYSWQLTADYGGAWQGAGLPAVSITLATVSSGHYLITVTGLRAVQVTTDDILSRDGRGDEVYVKTFVRQYDRRSGANLMFGQHGTLTYGDIDGRGTSRIQAGTKSGSGGIKSGDAIPSIADPTERAGNPSDIALPLRVFEGTLTDGVDALLISPTVWEEDSGTQAYLLWSAAMEAMTPQLIQRPEVQNQLARGSFAPIVFGSFAVNGSSNLNSAGLGAISMGLSFVVEGLFNGSADRPIGLVPAGMADSSVVLPNQLVVLTREIIEAALSPSGPGPVPVGPPAWPRIPKPGVMMIPFRDGALGLDRPGYYEMYLKVERLP